MNSHGLYISGYFLASYIFLPDNLELASQPLLPISLSLISLGALGLTPISKSKAVTFFGSRPKTFTMLSWYVQRAPFGFVFAS